MSTEWQRRVQLAYLVLLGIYALLSVACWFEAPLLLVLLETYPAMVLALGPAAWLFHKQLFIAWYAGTSVALLVFVSVALPALRRDEPLLGVGALIGAIAVWIGSLALVAATVY